MAADQGYGSALYYLAVECGIGNVLEKDDNLAARYLEAASEAGCLMADALIGSFYYSGEAFYEKDYDKAFAYFTRAIQNISELTAEMYAYVCRCLGACFRFGRGTEVDHSRASYFTEVAAEYGNEDALSVLQIIRK